jgi:outer membrane protein OmpA-like peptidoglycan-associated protein
MRNATTKMNLKSPLFLITLSMFLATISACSSTPQKADYLESARVLVQEVDRDPMAEEVAGDELAQAKAALQRADFALQEERDQEKSRYQAYLATRHAEIVKQRIAEKRSRIAIEEAKNERNRVLLQAREAETAKANQTAAEALAVAEARRLEAERNARQAELKAAEAEQARMEADMALAEMQRLQSELENLKAEQTARGLVLTLSDVLFDTDQSTLKPGAFLALDRVGEFLADNPARTLLIEGHTDSQGDDAYNLSLSARRSEAVKAALLQRGIDSSRLRTVGLGESYPVAANDTAAGRQQNRRVEIVISDKDGNFPAVAYRQ